MIIFRDRTIFLKFGKRPMYPYHRETWSVYGGDLVPYFVKLLKTELQIIE